MPIYYWQESTFRIKYSRRDLKPVAFLVKFGKVTSLRYSFCESHDETIMHLYMTA